MDLSKISLKQFYDEKKMGTATVKEASAIWNILGMKKPRTKRGRPQEFAAFKVIESGLPYTALETARNILEINTSAFAELLHINQRTLQRRKASNQLNEEESDRLYRVARITATALEIFGSMDKALEWLKRPNRAMNDEIPLKLLRNDAGIRMVDELLGRIAFGIYS